MKKALRYISAVLWTAWTGALTIVTGIAMIAGVSTLSEKIFNNNVVMGATHPAYWGHAYRREFGEELA